MVMEMRENVGKMRNQNVLVLKGVSWDERSEEGKKRD